MAILKNLAVFLSLVALLPTICIAVDSGMGRVINHANGQGQGQGQGQRQGGIDLDTILVKDENGKVNMAETLKVLQNMGFTLKDLLKMAGLGDNPQVLTIAEQFITDPNSLDEEKKVIVCEAMEVLMEDKPEVVNTMATLGMDTTTLCEKK